MCASSMDSLIGSTHMAVRTNYRLSEMHRKRRDHDRIDFPKRLNPSARRCLESLHTAACSLDALRSTARLIMETRFPSGPLSTAGP